MLRALVLKEVRETAWIGAIGLAALLALVGTKTNAWSPLIVSNRFDAIPMLSDTFLQQLAMVLVPMAIAMGLRQSLGDFLGDAQLFLLHRPASRAMTYGVKLAVGGTLQLVVGMVPVLLYSIWASTSGAHASPFFWSMTWPAWTICVASVAVYSGALLAGLRPAAWVGTRLAPLVAFALLAAMVMLLPIVWAWIVLAVAVAIAVVLVLRVVEERDFC